MAVRNILARQDDSRIPMNVSMNASATLSSGLRQAYNGTVATGGDSMMQNLNVFYQVGVMTD
ncbi:hypothetical protein LTR28_007875, partial [Elasticomyces elasticus]